MAKNFLHGDKLPRFLETLSGFGELHGPLPTDDGVTAFGPLRNPADLLVDYRRTILPPKKYLLPPRETILTHDPATGYRLPLLTPPKIVLVGVHPCDLAGIAYLDRVFTTDVPDPLYRARRDSLTLVGLSCEPDALCSCDDAAGETRGCDLFMERTGGGFSLTAVTDQGKNIFAALLPILAERAISPPPPRREPGVSAAIREAATHLETLEGSPLWDDFAARCLSCGACSLCCPTCYCFDVLEYGALDGTTAERLRRWDNCLFRDHGEVAGGQNFRKTRQERFRYRYRHKYLGFGPTRGEWGCVGCGRCREFCPTRIDLAELFTEKSHEG